MRNPVNPDLAHHKAAVSSIWEALDFISKHAPRLRVQCLPGAALQGRKLRVEPASAPALSTAPPNNCLGAGDALAALERVTGRLLELIRTFAANPPSTEGSSRENHGQSDACVVVHGTAMLPSGSLASPSLLRTERPMKYL